MPRYFFHVHDGKDLPDHEGTELPDLASARKEAVALAAGLLGDRPDVFWDAADWRLDVEDEAGRVLFSLRFSAVAAPVVDPRDRASGEG